MSRFVPFAAMLAAVGVLSVPGRSAVQPKPESAEVLLERHLATGILGDADTALTAALADTPESDDLRSALGLVRFFRAVERFGQTLYRHGLKENHPGLPLFRFPVGKNPKPVPVRPAHVRLAFEVLATDLAAAESVLAGVRDEKLKLPVKLRAVRFDFDADGKPEVGLIDLFKKLLRQEFEFLKANPDCLVKFDRGDVSWLRGYCHLLSSFADFYLAFDLTALFHAEAANLFDNPAPPPGGEKPNAGQALETLVIKYPERLGSFRRHLVQVCKLNKETWKFIRAETDDDFEWLPNPKQKGVIGLPVREEQIETWLGLVAEVEDFLEGRKVLDGSIIKLLITQHPAEMGLNFKTLLDDPPAKLNLTALTADGIDPKYLERNKPTVNLNTLSRVLQWFDNPLGMAYAAWFN